MRLFLLLVFILQAAVLFSQSLSTTSKKAVEFYREADNYRVRRQYDQAIEFLAAALKKDGGFVEAYAMLGNIHYSKGELEQAELYFEKAISLRPSSPRSLKSIFLLSKIQVTLEKYEQAKAHLETYMKLGGQGNPKARLLLSKAEYALVNIHNNIDFKPKPLSSRVNQFAMQYFPSFTADDSALFYTKRDGNGFNDDEDIMIAYRTADGSWGEPQPISSNINSVLNEGTCSVSADGRTLVFTSCQGRGGFGSCDLYISYKSGNEWSRPENMGAYVNSSAWESQPSLSADGSTLYFVSNRGGGIGGRDIWKSEYKDLKWSLPTNLGSIINTPFEEISPFIHPNGEVLYFASDGMPGFGGYDIYSSKLDSIWTAPQNFGYPINRGSDQSSLVISADGTRARYSESDHQGSQASIIKEFDIPKELRIENSAIYVKGRVVDAETEESIDAELQLVDFASGAIIGKYSSDSISGEFLTVLKKGGQYAYYAVKEGYVFNSYKFVIGENEKNRTLNIYLQPIKKGVTTVLNNIFFEFDSSELKDESKIELAKVAEFIRKNRVKLEIGGYTDATGSATYNLLLSEARARSVYDFLINAMNIPQNDLSYRGYGAENNEELKHLATARRIEFKIL